MEYQTTVKKEIKFQGKGLHTGVVVHLTVKPAEADTGIVFIRADQNPPVRLPANLDSIRKDVSDGRRTSLENGQVRVRTIEHLLAAFHGLGVDNAMVEIDGEELPGMDGSAKEFAEKILEAGLVSQEKSRTYFSVKDPIHYEDHEKSITVFPCDKGLKLTYNLSYRSEHLIDQHFSVEVSPDIFFKELAPARTFCLKEEALLLKAKGFGQGADFSNTLVFENNQPLGNELRFFDEACRHKIVDMLGDFYLLGKPLHAHIVACRTGHLDNLKVVSILKTKVISEIINRNGMNMEKIQEFQEMDVQAIQKIIPHRYPFLLVDRIVSMVPGKTAVGLKNVTINEHFFQGHFPEHPVMPGVLIIEAMAQVGGVLMLSMPENRNKLAYFMTIEEAKFRQPVHPGDQLRMKVEIIKLRSRTGQCTGKAYVGDKLVCEAGVKFAIVDR
ncbi:MAG: hypothetical protein A3G33_03770 [Omnitrophica bacterium RIFCSPLOWO2_12_FULL_44_17]|uniref:Multifunctional fusion protein n=1 Tax=Candidatus Danuiimicrobium aquiferis TaxID=1801832 RepID=A0A1G1KTK8_9BACT|nr:MAG: hypothetical protein A3B72_02030 [Omnitrophica bacterium RIFCSPHIGHO2_02_FULL_45_28]OGW90125.1 MAG: hypothetical protein A3E74_01655 [Omnitrophica bacterium RIFCSPHIGHO2_12_FULL_44_12]OGW95899.1 MAG: hypothetical protein A3G33_03770 [Omnitrophica bacterium RIFCSPLOWO2_12_FULL_44_17]OGX01898.1 MAG: hypothetical protein A3J12_05185 [Omnitrophica bacterium RIFCSPLOWO2_02_FULL_44_11]